MIQNFFNKIPKDIYGFETTDLIIIYLIIGAVFSLGMIIYDCAEAIVKQDKKELENWFPDRIAFIFFLLFLHPIFIGFFIIMEITFGIETLNYRIKKRF